MFKYYVLSTLILTSFSSMAFNVDVPKSIYGADNRQEAGSYPDLAIRSLSESVAAQISNDLITSSGADQVELKSEIMSEKLKVCKEERFSEENTVAHCSAFLVSPDTLMTASHCVIKEDACKSHKWVFGYKNDSNVIDNKNVYSCKSVKLNVGMDYAFVKLDRNVEGRKALTLRHKFLWKRKANFVVIGYPSGLPIKIADEVKEIPIINNDLYKGTKYFGLNADTFGGNSGSPVIDADTHEVTGILLGGNADYGFDPEARCFRTKKYNSTGNDGAEIAVKTNSVKIK